MENQKDSNLFDCNPNNNDNKENSEINLEPRNNPLCKSMGDEFSFNIVITPVDHEIVDQSMNISNIKNYNQTGPTYKSKSSKNIIGGMSNKRSIDSDNSTEDNENSIKGKSFDEIYEKILQKKPQKNDKYFKHSDVDKLKEILISKGKFNKDNNLINKLFSSEK